MNIYKVVEENVLTTTNTLLGRITSTRTTRLDALTKFGYTNETGGTSTGDSLIAKLNKLLNVNETKLAFCNN